MKLYCMCKADMWNVHPKTDFSHKCSACGEQVGLYPSGQNVLKKHGVENVELICNRCGDPFEGEPAPGALDEIRRYRR